MQTAPIDLETAEAPKHGTAFWAHADDRTRLRIGLWRRENTGYGSVLVFPGRTEYIEKYGRTVAALDDFGFSTFVIDWRGQGLSDRAADDPMAGHVVRFSDYHKDVAAMIKAADQIKLPKPWYLIGHSLGACIGLRALVDGLPVSSCAFTSPMWNIRLPAIKKAAAWPVSWMAQAVGKGYVYAPGTEGKSYVLSTSLEDNRLTNDSEMYQYFINQANKLADRQIGGPSIGWLYETLKETRALSRISSPGIPCITFCGTQDELVEIGAIRERMTGWSRGELKLMEDAKHDLFSEVPQIRERVMSDTCKLFTNNEGC